MDEFIAKPYLIRITQRIRIDLFTTEVVTEYIELILSPPALQVHSSVYNYAHYTHSDV